MIDRPKLGQVVYTVPRRDCLPRHRPITADEWRVIGADDETAFLLTARSGATAACLGNGFHFAPPTDLYTQEDIGGAVAEAERKRRDEQQETDRRNAQGFGTEKARYR